MIGRAAGSDAIAGEAGEGGGDGNGGQRKMEGDRSRHRSLEEDGGIRTLSTCRDISNPGDDGIPALALRGPRKASAVCDWYLRTLSSWDRRVV